jgi:N-acetylmuramoyl-L-alanine amidase
MAADGPMLSDLQACAGNVEDSENMALATATHASLVYHLQMYDRGIKRARFVVIRDINIPGVLIEGGFLSNAGDSRKIATAGYRQQMANCILAAVLNYRAAIGNRLPVPSMAGIRSLELRNLVESVNAPGLGSARPEPLVITPSTN